MSEFEIASMVHHVRQMDKARLEQDRLKQELRMRGIEPTADLIAQHRRPVNVIELSRHQPRVVVLQPHRIGLGRYAYKIA